MKIFLKKYFFSILSIVIGLTIVFYLFIDTTNQSKLYRQITIENFNKKCYMYNISDYENRKNDGTNRFESCYNTYNNLYTKGKGDALSNYFGAIEEHQDLLPYTLIFLVIIPAIFNFNQKTKKGNIKNVLIRINYKKFLRKEYFKSLLNIFIFPICLLVLLFLSYLYSKTFDIEKAKNFFDNDIPYEYVKHISPLYFMIVYFFNIILQSIFYVNLAHIINYKNKYVILTYIESFIAFIVLECMIEFIQPAYCHFSFFSIWNYYFSDEFMLLPTLTNVIFTILTFIILNFIYKDKEKVVISCDY